MLDLATPVKDAFTTELFETLPRQFADQARIQFCGPAGTDAVEAALKLVRTATGRSGILAFTGAYHGMTAGALAVSGGATDVRVTRLPYPQDYRCPFGVGGEHGGELAARWTENLLDDPKGGVVPPAGMILEPVQGEGGVIPGPDDWVRRMREITADRSIPLIADEVQTGVGRTGAFWAVEHSGIVPDVMVLSKAIGGSLPWRSSSTGRNWTSGSPVRTPVPSGAISSPWRQVRRPSRTSARTGSPSARPTWVRASSADCGNWPVNTPASGTYVAGAS